eukprot:2185724-Pleurochrysis_carterae.AAC.3
MRHALLRAQRAVTDEKVSAARKDWRCAAFKSKARVHASSRGLSGRMTGRGCWWMRWEVVGNALTWRW